MSFKKEPAKIDYKNARFGVEISEDYYRIFNHSNPNLETVGAAVLLEVKNKGFVLGITRRFSINYQESLEIVRGGLDKDEKLKDCAIREVKEETGITVKKVIELGKVYPDNGLIRTNVSLFYSLITEDDFNNREKDDNELEDIVILSENDLALKILKNEITDSFTLCAYLKYKVNKHYLKKTFR